VVTAARIAILCVLGLLTTGPLIGYMLARKRYGVCNTWSRRALAAYYLLTAIVATMLALAIAAPHFVLRIEPLDDAVRCLLLPGMILLPLGGPWIGCVGLALAARRSTTGCNRCGYDLTGNVSGFCPECGHPASSAADAHSSGAATRQRVPWVRIGGLWMAAVVLLFVLSGVQTLTWGRYCPDCGRSEFHVRDQWAIPWTSRVWLQTSDHLQPQRTRGFAISRLLDPGNTCTHNWTGLGGEVNGVTDGFRGIGNDVTRCVCADEQGFLDFVAAHPEAIDLMRADMRRRRSACDSVCQQYEEWIERESSR
jgi:ribosomal protein L37E